MDTLAHKDGNRRSAFVVRKRRKRHGPSSVSLLFRRCPFLLPLVMMLVLRDKVAKESSPSTRYGVVAFHAVELVDNYRSFQNRISNPNKCTGLLRIAVDNNDQSNKIRLNKVFKKTHSRRAADRLIEEGRVSVNGERVASKGGFFVVPYVDEVSLDGRIIEGWEEMNYVTTSGNNANVKGKQNQQPISKSEQKKQRAAGSSNNLEREQPPTFEYIKYWKPRGVICTTDSNIPGNIIDEIREHDGYDPPHRVYPVGRLDKDTTGIILLTSDGRLPNAALRKQHKRPKIYDVMVDPPIGNLGSNTAKSVLARLEKGVVISTETVRNGVRKTLTAPTEPCLVQQLNDQWIRITLKEGRNRQVRKMTQAVGHRTIELERVSFAGIPLEPGLRGPGDWDYLQGEELEIVKDMIQIAAEAQEVEGAFWESNE